MLTSDTVERPKSQALYAGWRTAGDLGGTGTVYGKHVRRLGGRRRRVGSQLTRNLRRHLPGQRAMARFGVRWRELPSYVRGLLILGAATWLYIFLFLWRFIREVVLLG